METQPYPQQPDSAKPIEKSHEQYGNIEINSPEVYKPYPYNIIKLAAQSIFPYIDEKIEIKLTQLSDREQPGYYRRQTALGYSKDFIDINLSYRDISQLLDTIFHELGHALDDKLRSIAKNANLNLCKELNQEYPDLIAYYILRPEEFERNLHLSMVKNTYECLKKLFPNNNFMKIRAELQRMLNSYKQEIEKKNNKVRQNPPKNFPEENIESFISFYSPDPWTKKDYKFVPFTKRGFDSLIKQAQSQSRWYDLNFKGRK